MSPRPLRLAVVVASMLLLWLTVAAPASVLASSPTRGATGVHGSSRTVARGYDVSWPQCGSSLPAKPAFGIVGVNKGIVFSANPCLSAEMTWSGSGTELYANTGNPGPALSSHWPTGQTSPRFCDPASPDSAACAYDYGWNAAADSFQDAASAWQALGRSGAPTAVPWWLDVETGNSWRTTTSLNVAELQGEVASLQAQGITRIGFYSTSLQWGQITGSSSAFAAFPSWVAGAQSQKAAQSRCTGAGFTGGPVALAQYPYQGFDADLTC